MPKIYISLLRQYETEAKRVFSVIFDEELDWTTFALEPGVVATIRGTFDKKNRGYSIVLLVHDEQVFDAGGYLTPRQPAQFGIKHQTSYVGIFFEPDDVKY